LNFGLLMNLTPDGFIVVTRQPKTDDSILRHLDKMAR
jgi:hypothetical protein